MEGNLPATGTATATVLKDTTGAPGLELELRTAILEDPEGAITEMNSLGAELIDKGLPDPDKLARLNEYYKLAKEGLFARRNKQTASTPNPTT